MDGYPVDLVVTRLPGLYTGRTPQQVMDDAMWGVFAEGWRSGFGADADHLKTPQDIDQCVATGYTFYTFDPGEYVESAADNASPNALRARLDALPWEQLEDSPREILHVTFGSVLTAQGADGQRIFYDRLMEVLRTHPEAYAADLEVHFLRHLRPFVIWGAR